jgi:hypothetical protein
MRSDDEIASKRVRPEDGRRNPAGGAGMRSIEEMAAAGLFSVAGVKAIVSRQHAAADSLQCARVLDEQRAAAAGTDLSFQARDHFRDGDDRTGREHHRISIRPHAGFTARFSCLRLCDISPQGSCHDMPVSIGFSTAPPLSAQSLNAPILYTWP